MTDCLYFIRIKMEMSNYENAESTAVERLNSQVIRKQRLRNTNAYTLLRDQN